MRGNLPRVSIIQAWALELKSVWLCTSAHWTYCQQCWSIMISTLMSVLYDHASAACETKSAEHFRVTPITLQVSVRRLAGVSERSILFPNFKARPWQWKETGAAVGLRASNSGFEYKKASGGKPGAEFWKPGTTVYANCFYFTGGKSIYVHRIQTGSLSPWLSPWIDGNADAVGLRERGLLLLISQCCSAEASQVLLDQFDSCSPL